MRASDAVIERVMRAGPVMPVIVLESPEKAVPIASALLAGGISVIEVTLRTETALKAISAIAEAVDGVTVGAGTVLDAAQLDAAHRAGAAFAVSPGATPRLLDAARDHPLPLLPGAATASEVMGLLERGYRLQKFFPAEAAGGVASLKALASPLRQAKFCPTGGITAASAGAYLALSNVICVGGSWVAPAEAVAKGDWPAIEALARAASELARQ